MPKLTRFTQENVLSLLAQNDEYCLLVRNAINRDLFDYPYNEFVDYCISFIDKYKQAPKDHLADGFEKELQGENAEKYREVISFVFSQKNLNAQYILDSLRNFIRERKFETAFYEAAEQLAKGNIDEAQLIIEAGSKSQLTVFDSGIKLTNLEVLARSLEEEEIFSTGIQALDKEKVGPARKQIFILLGKKSCGKSWGLINIGKRGLWHNLKVVHITLEISKEIALQRYIQNILSLSRWHYDTIKSPLFVRDGNGQVIRIDNTILHPDALADEEIITSIKARLSKLKGRLDNLRIKEFGTGQLTLTELKLYLDGLEKTENFIPDILILDMASHMKLDIKDFRLQLGRLFVELRGLAMERNLALVTAHHINREGAKAKFTTGEHISEDWSILGTVDTAVIYNQRKQEKKHNIARLYVDRGRSMKSGFSVIMVQNYSIGQFCLDSELLGHDYDPEKGLKEEAEAEAESTEN